MRHKIVFGADLHGDEHQYTQLVDYAIANSADSIIIAGDLCPKRLPIQHFQAEQRRFLETAFPRLLEPFRKSRPSAGIYLITGNDDCASNLDTLAKHDGSLYHVINSTRMGLTPDFDVVGYPYVSITPFRLKDWEQYDFSDVPPRYEEIYTNRLLTGCRLDGLKSARHGWSEFRFDPSMAIRDSIQDDLSKPLFRQSPEKTVYVIHDPPYGTHLDLVSRGHVGSLAVRDFIETAQPYLTLHGHIHETVELSGRFANRVGDTICMAPGNLEGKGLALIVFDLYTPLEASRVVIPPWLALPSPCLKNQEPI